MLPNFFDRSKMMPFSLPPICSFTNDTSSLISTVLGERYFPKLAPRLQVFLFAFLIATLGCDSTSTNRQMTNEVGEVELRKIALGSANISFGKDFTLEIEKAMNAKQSIVFAHVKWAPMGFQRQFFCNFANTYRDSHPRDATSFHYIDFTQMASDSAPLKKLNGWSELRPGSRVVHGNGELIWIVGGKIVSNEPIMNYTLKELVKKTETLFKGEHP